MDAADKIRVHNDAMSWISEHCSTAEEYVRALKQIGFTLNQAAEELGRSNNYGEHKFDVLFQVYKANTTDEVLMNEGYTAFCITDIMCAMYPSGFNGNGCDFAWELAVRMAKSFSTSRWNSPEKGEYDCLELYCKDTGESWLENADKTEAMIIKRKEVTK